LQLNDLLIPLMCNVDARLIHTAAEARDTLIRQVTGSVLWAKSVGELIGLGVEQFVEIGPGTALSGMLRQIDKSKKCVNACDEASLAKLREQFGL
jgi:[acyl-carrier-protein] S-malonyltransferase